MTIDIPNNEWVDFVNMGSCNILSSNSKQHLLTYGLWPCTGVAIVIKSNSWELIRLLAHIDMWQLLGISIESFARYLKTMKNKIADWIKSVEIFITSTESFKNLENLKEDELKLVNLISSEFKENWITPKDIKYNYSTQVQISPQWKISTYSESELKLHEQNMLAEDINRFGGYIEPNLNIYITKYWAWMSGCWLKNNATEEEKKNFLISYYEDDIKNGYKLKIAPSFIDSNSTAVYLKNWKDKRLWKRWWIPGCKTAKRSRNITAA